MKSWMERLIMILTIVGSVGGGFIYLDTNYASAADLKKLEQNLKRDRLFDRAQDLQNKIFELEFKQRQTPREFTALDAAILERSKQEIREIQRRMRDLEK